MDIFWPHFHCAVLLLLLSLLLLLLTIPLNYIFKALLFACWEAKERIFHSRTDFFEKNFSLISPLMFCISLLSLDPSSLSLIMENNLPKIIFRWVSGCSMVYGECGVKNEWKKGDGFGARNGSSFPEGLNGGGGDRCRLKFYYFVSCQLKFPTFVGCR